VTAVDVVVVAYNSRDRLRDCVEPLAMLDGVRVIVVDNDSPDRGLEAIADLPVRALQLDRNGGFSFGCNHGWRAGDRPYVLFLNPDARIDERSIRALAGVLEGDARVELVGPRTLGDDGTLLLSQRRFPCAASTYARAFLLNRLLPAAAWASELVPAGGGAYERPGRPDWVAGSCMLVRRSALERLGGFDEGFFLYCEDKDLCRRIRDGGGEVAFEPRATCVHEGGASAPRPRLYGVLAGSRVRYARKHGGAPAALLERVGVGLLALTRMLAGPGGSAGRAGHAASLRVVAGLPDRRGSGR
jgi:N-acetylglucosaminyl-diphospho-decaprenol L-rhamnosyltransferase